MNQNAARTLLLAGLATFLVSLGAEISSAHGWSELAQTAFVGKMIMQLGGVGTAIWGALKVKA